MATREQQRAFYAAFMEAFPWVQFISIPLGTNFGPDFVDIVVLGTIDGPDIDLESFLHEFEPAIQRPDWEGGDYWSFPTESLDAAIREMAAIAARNAEEEANRERLDDLFYRALELAAPDLDYTAIPCGDERHELAIFRINGPVSEGLNSIIGLHRCVDPETGEDECRIGIDDLEVKTEDLRDFAAAQEHAAEAEAMADSAIQDVTDAGQGPQDAVAAKPRKRALDLGPDPPRRRVRPKKA